MLWFWMWFDSHKIKTFTVQSKSSFALVPLKGKTITVKKRHTHFNNLKHKKNDKASSLSLYKMFNQLLLTFCSSTSPGLLLPPKRLKKEINPEVLACPFTWFSSFLPSNEQTPSSLIFSVLDPEEYDLWDMLLWNKSPSRRRAAGDRLVSSMETDLRRGPCDTALWLGHSGRDVEPSGGHVRLSRFGELGR